jgi:hypothetical protein
VVKKKLPDNRQEVLAHPEQWKTGDEPMTAAQEAYANTLAKEAGERPVESDLTKAEASRKIEELKREVDEKT